MSNDEKNRMGVTPDDDPRPNGCAQCGSQPRGSVLGEQVCSVRCADYVVKHQFLALTYEWESRINNNERGDEYLAGLSTAVREVEGLLIDE